MKGIIAENMGAPLQVTDDLELPEPSANQILIKSIYTAINPVYGLLFLRHVSLTSFLRFPINLSVLLVTT
jgi:NADPH:quinone reductase-like Zn-dependent oxidoreductase